jgi:hypothetical protein
MIQNTANIATNFADRPEFGHGEVVVRPIAVPKVKSTKEIADASTAPARIGPHSTKPVFAVEATLGPVVAGPGPT